MNNEITITFRVFNTLTAKMLSHLRRVCGILFSVSVTKIQFKKRAKETV